MSTLSWPAPCVLPSDYLGMTIAHRGNQNALPHDQVVPVFSGYVALARQFMDHIHDDVVLQSRSGQKRITPIQAVSALGFSPVASPRLAWPQTLQELLESPPTVSNEVNAEWVAALLLASGADPWKTYAPYPNGHPYVYEYPPAMSMVINGWAGILRNTLRHPNARSINEVAGLPFKGPYKSTKTLREYVFQGVDANLLNTMIDEGLVLPSDPETLVSELGGASQTTIETLSSRDILSDLPNALINKVKSIWMGRVKSKELAANVVSQMVSTLLPDHATDTQKSRALASEIDGILSKTWGDAKSHPRIMNVGASELNRRAPSVSQHKGTWSLFGAHAMSYLRRAGPKGVEVWLPSEMLSASFVPGKGMVAVDVFEPQYKGLLAPAVQTQWRHGITMAAPVLLSVLAQDCRMETSVQPALEQLTFLSGVPNAQDWVKNNANEMAQFTTAILRPNALAQHKVLMSVWANALQGPYGPSIVKGLSDENRINVLLALTGNFQYSKIWPDLISIFTNPFNVFEDIYKKIRIPLSAQVDRQGLDNLAHQAKLVFLLGNSDHTELVKFLNEMAPSLSRKSAGMEILNMWMKAQKDQPQSDEIVSQVKVILLKGLAEESRVGISSPISSGPKL